MASISRFRPVAIALVLQDDDGNLQIIGSKSVNEFMIEMSQDAIPPPFLGGGWTQGPRSYHIEADCSSALWQTAASAPLPRQIEQRGIYLPDMSFRALPGPDEA